LLVPLILFSNLLLLMTAFGASFTQLLVWRTEQLQLLNPSPCLPNLGQTRPSYV
jgi:hypothetical protein